MNRLSTLFTVSANSILSLFSAKRFYMNHSWYKPQQHINTINLGVKRLIHGCMWKKYGSSIFLVKIDLPEHKQISWTVVSKKFETRSKSFSTSKSWCSYTYRDRRYQAKITYPKKLLGLDDHQDQCNLQRNFYSSYHVGDPSCWTKCLMLKRVKKKI